MIVETLRVFVSVAEQLNFSRAAEQLNMSQPGVSLHIRNLEHEFDTKLMHRSSKQVKLTEAGELLYSRAKQILSIYEATKQDISLLQGALVGTIHVGASFTIGEYVLPRALADFAREYPHIGMQVTIANTSEIAQGIRTNELDIGLVEGQIAHADLSPTAFMKDEMIFVAAPKHPAALLRNPGLKMLQDQTWILRENGSGTRAFSDRYIAEHHIQMKRSFVFSSSQGVKEAVCAGLGIAMLSRLIVHRELLAGELVELPVHPTKLTRSFYILENKDAMTSRSRDLFINKLVQLAK